MNATTQESPKLASAPVAGVFEDSTKLSPALAHTKPANSRARQISAAQTNGISSRPSTSIKAVDSPRLAQVELANPSPDHNDERSRKKAGGNERDGDDTPTSTRGGAALERSASKQSQLKREARADSTSRRTASPRLTAALPVEQIKVEKSGKSSMPKISTPLLGSFADVDPAADSAPDTASATENGVDSVSRGASSKARRLVKPRMKDHHGLQDSLSPKALPPKRTHKKNSSYSLMGAASMSRSNTRDIRDEEPVEGKQVVSRGNSRSMKNGNDRSRDDRSTPTGKTQEEADMGVEGSRRNTATRGRVLDVKPPTKTVLEELPGNSTDDGDSGAPGRSTRAGNNAEQSSSSPISPDADEKNVSIHDQEDNIDLGSNDDGDEEEEVEPHPSQLSTQEVPSTSLDQALSLPPPLTDPSLPLSATSISTTGANNDNAITTSTLTSKPPPAESNLTSPSEPESDLDPDADEQRYCYCNQISYGEMVACDNPDCAREWFHLACTELRSLPSGRMTWYCEECRK